jgi:hypothetical protein
MTGPEQRAGAHARAHRPRPGPQAPRGLYDPRERAFAARIERANPHWHIEWGVGSRRFYAYPLFEAPPGTLVSATNHEDLIAEMRRTEHRFKAWQAGMGS